MTAQNLWKAIIAKASKEEQLRFVRDIAGNLARTYTDTGNLPQPLTIGWQGGGSLGIQFKVFPVGDIGSKLRDLSDFLDGSKYVDGFSVWPTRFADEEFEEVKIGDMEPWRLGLLMTFDGLPALIISGEPDRLRLRMDGFERILISMPEEIPGLWDRVRRAEGVAAAGDSENPILTAEGKRRQDAIRRREAARNRKDLEGPIGKLGLSVPKKTIRPIFVDGNAGPVSGTDFLLVPIKGRKETPGAYPARKILETLRIGLAVQSILADYQLRAITGEPARAREELERVLPRTGAHLRELGVANLAGWTQFDTLDQLKHWAQEQHPKRTEKRNRPEDHSEAIDATLAPVRILSNALTHAERVISAHDRAEREPSETASQIIAEAYRDSPFTAMGLDDLFQIAMLADINPIAFWPLPHQDHALHFEVARIMGRIVAGDQVVILPHIQSVILELLGQDKDQSDLTKRTVVAEKSKIVVNAIVEFIGGEAFVRTLSDMAGSDQNLLIERKTRKMRIVAAN